VKAWSALLSLCVAPTAVAAQAPRPPAVPAAVERAANTITLEDVRRRVHLLADDSMKGRDTPSPELDKAAAYIAAEFGRMGLRPAGDSGSFVQRYAITRRAVDTAASVLVADGARAGTLKLGRDVVVLPFVPLPTGEVAGPVLVMAGATTDTANRFGGQDVKGAWIVTAAKAGQGPAGLTADWASLQAAMLGGARGVIVVSDRPDSAWARMAATMLRPAYSIEGGGPRAFEAALLEVRDAAAQQLLGIDAAALRAATGRSVERLGDVTLTLRPRFAVLSRITAPNVVGVVEGSDPTLRGEYVLFSAHMDHVGVSANGRCRARGADSICNGADDDASGTVAVIEMAEAFARLHPRPRRSMIFLTVSGEERGLWGSRYFADNPPFPMSQIVANLNMDMVGRNWPDTIAVIGRQHSNLGETLDRVAAAHPELNMRPIDDIWPQENFYRRSDHYNFAVKGVPILFFFNGTHVDYHQVSDHPDKIDADKESRLARLVFYLGYEIAQSNDRPKWNPDSYKQIVQATN
jgi:Zn-dependent M28 family amino/carboxypeptidase